MELARELATLAQRCGTARPRSMMIRGGTYTPILVILKVPRGHLSERGLAVPHPLASVPARAPAP